MSGLFGNLGACEMTFNGTSLGYTYGGVKFKDKIESVDIFKDQFGKTPTDKVDVGGACEVEMQLTESTLDQLAAVIPGGSKPSTNRLDVKTSIGRSLYDNAGELILKPLVDGVAGPNTSWITIPKCALTVDLEVVFDSETQRVFKVLGFGFPDPTTRLKYYFGS